MLETRLYHIPSFCSLLLKTHSKEVRNCATGFSISSRLGLIGSSGGIFAQVNVCKPLNHPFLLQGFCNSLIDIVHMLYYSKQSRSDLRSFLATALTLFFRGFWYSPSLLQPAAAAFDSPWHQSSLCICHRAGDSVQVIVPLCLLSSLRSRGLKGRKSTVNGIKSRIHLI